MDCWDILSEIRKIVVCLIPLGHYTRISSQAILHAKSEVQAQSDKESTL